MIYKTAIVMGAVGGDLDNPAIAQYTDRYVTQVCEANQPGSGCWDVLCTEAQALAVVDAGFSVMTTDDFGVPTWFEWDETETLPWQRKLDRWLNQTSE